MMSSMTKTFEFGRFVSIRRMSLAVAATICTSQLRQRPDLVDQEQVRRLGDRHREHVAHAEQRQHQVGLDVLARQQLDALGIAQAGIELGVGDAVLAGQALDDLLLGAELQLDEDFAQQLVLPSAAAAQASAVSSASIER